MPDTKDDLYCSYTTEDAQFAGGPWWVPSCKDTWEKDLPIICPHCNKPVVIEN